MSSARQKALLIQLPPGSSVVMEEEHPERVSILWVAGSDIELTFTELDADLDDSAAQWERFLCAIEASHGNGAWFTVGQVADQARRGTLTLPDSLDGADERSLGKGFANHLGTKYGERALYLSRRFQAHKKQSEWRVQAGDDRGWLPEVAEDPDPLKHFLESCCEERRNLFVTVCDLMTAYLWFAEQNEDHYPLRREEFSEQLTTKGFRQNRSRRTDGKQCRTWEGLALRPWALKIARSRKEDA